MDDYKGVALGVEAAWPALVLALAQAVAPAGNLQEVTGSAQPHPQSTLASPSNPA